MFASRQVEVPVYTAIGRKRRRGFSELAQTIGRAAIQFLQKNDVTAAKPVDADLTEFAAPENAEIVSGTKA